MAVNTVAILCPGDMGHAVGRALGGHGVAVITCLEGRSARTRALGEQAGIRAVADFDSLVGEADLILSILPPASAVAMAGTVAEAMKRTGATPPYADCNAVSPGTAREMDRIVTAVGAAFIDGGIIGTKPGGGYFPRLYVSGADTGPAEAIHDKAFQVMPMGAGVGRGSAIKMCYAGLTKGTWTLYTAVLVAAEAMGLSDELAGEFKHSQADAYARMQSIVPRLPADSGRWIGEMEEIATTFDEAGVTPGFHQGAAAMFRLLAATPFAEETRETVDANRSLEETVRVFAQHLKP
jgi:L-threonate 2-dehydrogenase